MSYFLDDDASQVRELKDKLEKLQSDFLSTQFSVSQENVESGQSTFPIANPSSRPSGNGTGGGSFSEPLLHTITTITPVTLPTKTNIDSSVTNIFKITLDRDIEFDITNPNATKFEILHIVITQDPTTARTILWPGSVNGIPAIDTTLGSETTVSLFNMGDNVWRYVSTKGGIIGFSGNLSDVTIDVDKNWNAKSITNLSNITMGGTVANSGFTRLTNDAIGMSWRNIADDGNLELKVDSGDFFDFTESNNGPVSLKIRAQHATNPDNTITITQLSGTAGVGQFFAPNEMKFLGSGSSDVFNYDQNRIETNVNINPDADGTINLGGTLLRYLAVHAASFKFGIDRRLDFNTGGGGITVDGVGDSFTITVDPTSIENIVNVDPTPVTINTDLQIDLVKQLQVEVIASNTGEARSKSGAIVFYGDTLCRLFYNQFGASILIQFGGDTLVENGNDSCAGDLSGNPILLEGTQDANFQKGDVLVLSKSPGPNFVEVTRQIVN